MEMIQKVDIRQLRSLLSEAKSVSDIKRLNRFIPEITPEEREIAHERLNDGIYKGKTLVGENNPDD